MTTLVSGAFTATGNSPAFVPVSDFTRKDFNCSIWGTFAGTVQVQRSFDGGATWLPRNGSRRVRADLYDAVL